MFRLVKGVARQCVGWRETRKLLDCNFIQREMLKCTNGICDGLTFNILKLLLERYRPVRLDLHESGNIG